MKKPGQGPAWGFAVTRTGTLVIRNWYLLFGSLGIGLSGLLLLNFGFVLAFLGFILSVYGWWSLYLEIGGVRVRRDVIRYPIRLAVEPALFARTLEMSEVLQASSARTSGMWIVYLSGEFGQAKIVFDSKGGRDRLLTIVKTYFPNVTIYRWS